MAAISKERAVIGLLIVGAGAFMLWPARETPPVAASPATPAVAQRVSAPPPATIPAAPPGVADATPESIPVPAKPAPIPAAPTAPPPPVQTASPISKAQIETDIEQVQFKLRDFRTKLGGNPVGTNAEIMRALLGDNPKQLKLAVPDGSQLNAGGELCDRWGTPYFFHQLSGTSMEVRSAGPDRVMWTGDDRVGK